MFYDETHIARAAVTAHWWGLWCYACCAALLVCQWSQQSWFRGRFFLPPRCGEGRSLGRSERGANFYPLAGGRTNICPWGKIRKLCATGVPCHTRLETSGKGPTLYRARRTGVPAGSSPGQRCVVQWSGQPRAGCNSIQTSLPGPRQPGQCHF